MMIKKLRIPMDFSLRQRIHWSFAMVVLLFVINGVITLILLRNNRKAYEHITTIADPSIEALHDFRKVVRESVMFTTNLVFVRSVKEEKNALRDIHITEYPALK